MSSNNHSQSEKLEQYHEGDEQVEIDIYLDVHSDDDEHQTTRAIKCQTSDIELHTNSTETGAASTQPDLTSLFKQMEAMQRELIATRAEVTATREYNQILQQQVFSLQAQSKIVDKDSALQQPAQEINTPQENDRRNPALPIRTCKKIESPYKQSVIADVHNVTVNSQPNNKSNRMQSDFVDLPPKPSEFTADLRRIEQPAIHNRNNLLVQKPFELPEFAGFPDQWPEFIAAYHQSTEAFGYGPLQNLFRLQKCLKGAARASVQFLLTDPDNIEDILDDLQFRFGRPEQLVQNQTNKLREFAIIEDRQIDRFVEFSSIVQNMVAFLNKDESRHVLGETVLMAELINKLPPAKQLQWAEHAMNLTHRATAIDFSKWLRQIARCVTTLSLPQPVATFTSSNHASTQRNTHQRQRQVNNINNVSTAKCGECHQAHRTIDCMVFKERSVEDRLETARRERLCYGCLRTGHSIDVCRSKQRCPVNQCGAWHHELIHTNMDQNAASNNNPFTTRSPDNSNVILSCYETFNLPLLFRVIPVKLFGPARSVDTFALLDEGSALTLIEADLAKQIGANGPETELTMNFVGGASSSENSKVVTFEISGVGGNAKRYPMKNVRTTKSLGLPPQTINMAELDSRFHHLRGLPVSQFRDATPRILIGLEHADLGVSSMIHQGSSGPIACKTRLGWVVFGSQGHVSNQSSTHCGLVHLDDNKQRLDELERIVKGHYTTENFGVTVPEKLIESNDDARARHILRETTIRIGGRFQTGLLWKQDDIVLPDSYGMAQRRLGAVLRKMRADPEYERLYRDQIEGYIRKGYARKLTLEETNTHDRRTWYLPHFGVKNPNKPGKLRLVFDAAAGVNGVSLNSALLKGPDMNEPMTSILFRFRMRNVAICGDIAEMFSQVLIQPSDRNSQRFLWVGEKPGHIDTYQMNAMTFGATCSPTSAQYVKNSNADEFASEFPAASKAIRLSHYVDDYVASFETESEAIQITKDVIDVHRRAGFDLRKFVSNSQIVLEALDSELDARSTVDMELDAAASSRILGMRWRTDEDAFYFAIHFPNINTNSSSTSTRRPTKRELLSAVMSVYDPFGFLGVFMLPAKILLQELWRTNIGWDEEVPTAIDKKWQTWRQQIPSAEKLRIPRCYSKYLMISPNIELHVFADASELAFSAVAYWRIINSETSEVAFITGKTRCAPLKQLSVPRLELQAAVLATRLTSSIRECHDVNITRLIMWSDSRTVLHWIRSEQRRYKPFVAHRVAEIVDGVGSSCWRWVPTKFNVADDATRISLKETLDDTNRWLRGPAFLINHENDWPIEPMETAIKIEDKEEIRSRFVGAAISTENWDKRFSNYLRLCRAMAWALRFIKNTQTTKKNRRAGELEADEIREATLKLCKLSQMAGFSSEYRALSQGRPIDRSSPLLKLMPYLDSKGIMRLYGRTDLADNQHLSEDAKRPILLPTNHRITQLLVQYQHNKMGHQFEDGTICAVRQRYWVPNLRTLVRRVKSSCQECKIREARPKPPVAGQLPIDRLTPYVNPFTYTGLDFFGPVIVTVGRRTEKRWIALFTCLTVRAVHMEVAQDLSSDACILCIRNFANTRGIPSRIRSDCGTNFVGADGEIRKMSDFLDVDIIGRELATKGIEWKFNCPANPEAGGIWERLVQSSKRVLQVTLKGVAPRVETLRSLIIEAANIINARPLTHIPVNPSDPNPLTPNHFLLGRTNSTTMPIEANLKQFSSRKQWRVLQQMNNQFWRQWVREYLPELTRRSKHYGEVGPIKEGSLVMICDANLSRNQWHRGRVEQAIIGTDGRVRTAHVRTSSGLMRRPVSKLALLDICGSEPISVRTHGARDVAHSIDPMRP